MKIMQKEVRRAIVPVNFEYALRTQLSDTRPTILMIWDESEILGGRSVTNAVEDVLALIKAQIELPEIVIYCDSMGVWDQIKHADGVFVEFAPLPRGKRADAIAYAFSLAEK